MKKSSSLILLFLGLLLLAVSPLRAQTKRIPVAYSAISATQSAFYLAKEAKLFERHGLYVDPVYWDAGWGNLGRDSVVAWRL